MTNCGGSRPIIMIAPDCIEGVEKFPIIGYICSKAIGSSEHSRSNLLMVSLEEVGV
jgi:hypothetical protein